MNKQTNVLKQVIYRFAPILLVVFTLISCEPFASNASIQTEAALSESSEAAFITPPTLPPLFQTTHINPLDTPHTYVDHTCRYLKNKWTPYNAAPGTIVMILMIGRVQPVAVTESYEITEEDLIKTMHELKMQGFEAIKMKEFLSYIERNVKIPPRSVLIIQDGNYDQSYFNRYYRQYWENWGWTIVNGWQSDPEIPDSLWLENLDMEEEGFLDHQAMGATPGTTLSDESAKTVIARELKNSLDVFGYNYRKNPYAFIWPNGGFGQRPVEAARLLKYQLGFTANQRGPVMYNWVPLADELDPNRPDYRPEGKINDPLMTLPRYHASEVFAAIDQVRAIGKEAAAYAEANKDIELEYYDIVCSEEYGRIPTP
ncbi:MAG: hypothetical protein IH588_05755 [Anaerolineales bacterium]|nr:hypothetical protein [Anaerolineales bacterium]